MQNGFVFGGHQETGALPVLTDAGQCGQPRAISAATPARAAYENRSRRGKPLLRAPRLKTARRTTPPLPPRADERRCAGCRAHAMHELLGKLSGTDRRSIKGVPEVVAKVLAEPELFPIVFDGMSAADAVVRMRCADAVEKITIEHPEYLTPWQAAHPVGRGRRAARGALASGAIVLAPEADCRAAAAYRRDPERILVRHQPDRENLQHAGPGRHCRPRRAITPAHRRTAQKADSDGQSRHAGTRAKTPGSARQLSACGRSRTGAVARGAGTDVNALGASFARATISPVWFAPAANCGSSATRADQSECTAASPARSGRRRTKRTRTPRSPELQRPRRAARPARA